MTTALHCLILLLGILCLLGTPALANTPPPLQVVLDNNYPPYCYLDSSGRLQGILVDRWKLWEERTGIPVSVKGLDWGEALRRMRAGEFDVIDTAFKTKEREQWLDFGTPHTRIHVPIYFHKDLGGITDLQSIHDFLIGVKEGDAAIEIAHAAGVSQLRLYHNYENLIEAARLGQIRIFIMDQPPASYFLQRAGIEGEFRRSNPVSSGDFHRAVAKGRSQLLYSVERGFAAIPAKELAAIDEHWMGRPATGGRSLNFLLYIGAGALSLIVVLGIWNQLLRWQVRRRTQALAASEKQFRDMIEFLPIPVGIFTRDEKIEYINREFELRLGYRLVDIPDINTWATLAYQDPEYRESARRLWTADIQEALRTGASTPTREFRLLAKDGSLHEMELCARPVGERIVVIFTDVTERNGTELRLKQSEARYRRLHASIQDGYARTDLSGMIVETNPAFREMLGYSEAELAQLSYSQITPERWHAAEEQILQEQVLVRGYSQVYEKEYLRKDGRFFPVELRTHLLTDDEGKAVGYWAIIRDVSEKRRLSTQLSQALNSESGDPSGPAL